MNALRKYTPPHAPSEEPKGASELQKRIQSGIVMAGAAIGTAWLGGWPFALLWTIAAVAVAYEWQRLIYGEYYFIHFLLTAISVLLAAAGGFFTTPSLILAAAACSALSALVAHRGKRIETASGVFYAAGFCAAVILCRGQGSAGLIVLGWLFAVVWGTDILAYFTGRALGGPKLWPQVSPKKTWSGAIGGLFGGVALGCSLLSVSGIAVSFQHIALSVAFSILTQSGDLYESAMKRRHDAKDSGTLIPGHGGFMDRLDGFIFAVIGAACFGAIRNGFTGVSQGLLVW